MTQRRVHVWVSGRVQGVFYRESTRQVAAKHGISGWVKNLPDGRVEAVLEGDADQVEHLVQFMREGPDGAHVKDIEIAAETPTGEFTGFQVVRGR